MRYHSTNRDLNRGIATEYATFSEALFTGIAPDGGLFMPVEIPPFSESDFRALRGKPYSEIAYAVLRKFIDAEIDGETLKDMVKDTYSFDIPIESIEPSTHLVRLDRGPTASFKDFAARFMARMMSHLRRNDQQITILVATSGDTGSAVGEAYKGADGFRVYILYPEQEVSPIQKQQLDAIGENVQALSVSGKFDDCQNLVKRAFADSDLVTLNLTSANSINIGRLLPQIVYYVYAYSSLMDDLKPVVFSVPSGNFGSSLGCELARRMGLPIEKLVIAVNENDEFPRFLETGSYEIVHPSRVCLSNAMNVGNPSNLARYFDLYGGILTSEGKVHRMPDLEQMRQYLLSISVSDAETVELIKEVYEEKGLLIEPHGAVGVVALKRFRETGNRTPAICLETAHPGKFQDILEQLLHIEIDMPNSLLTYSGRERRVDHLENNYEELKTYLTDRH